MKIIIRDAIIVFAFTYAVLYISSTLNVWGYFNESSAPAKRSLIGQEVLETTIFDNGFGSKKIDLSYLNVGVYVLLVELDGEVLITKIEKH
jgi:hypothetical protein